MAEFLTAVRTRPADHGGGEQQQLARADPLGADGPRLPRVRGAASREPRVGLLGVGPRPAAAFGVEGQRRRGTCAGRWPRRWPSTGRRWSTWTSTPTSRRCPGEISVGAGQASSPRRSLKGQPHRADIARPWPRTRSRRSELSDDGVLATSTPGATPRTRDPDRPEPYIRVRDLAADLSATVDGEVRFDPGSRGAYCTDSSNYRQVPLGVVLPRTVEAGVAGHRGVPGARRPDHLPRRRDKPGRRDHQRGGHPGLVEVLPPAGVGRRARPGPPSWSRESCSTSSTRNWLSTA